MNEIGKWWIFFRGTSFEVFGSNETDYIRLNEAELFAFAAS